MIQLTMTTGTFWAPLFKLKWVVSTRIIVGFGLSVLAKNVSQHCKNLPSVGSSTCWSRVGTIKPTAIHNEMKY